jgi:hypothetical protein
VPVEKAELVEAAVPFEDEKDPAVAQMVPYKGERDLAEAERVGGRGLGYPKSKCGLLMAQTQPHDEGSSRNIDEERESDGDDEERETDVSDSRASESDGEDAKRWSDGANGHDAPVPPLQTGAALAPCLRQNRTRKTTKRGSICSSIQKFICFHTCHAV